MEGAEGQREERECRWPPCSVLPWAFTCHNGFPVPFPVRPDPYELLPKKGSYVCVAVHKYPHRVL